MIRKPITLRPANPDDSDFVWRLRSDPRIYAFSGNPQPINWSIHKAWFERILVDPARHLFIADHTDERIGFVRLDATARPAVADVSIAVDPALQGRGYGQHILRYAIEEASAAGFTTVIGTVNRGNKRSMGLFQASGFVHIETEDSTWTKFEWRMDPTL